MKIRKLPAYLLSALLLFGAVLGTGCKTVPVEPAGTEAPTGTLTREEPTGTDETPEPTPAAAIPVSELDQLKIVFPDGASDALLKAADGLRVSVKNAWGREVPVSNDYLREGSTLYCELPYEILLGDTARAESGKVLNDLRYDDWGYVLEGKKIVIKGGSETALLNAITDFNYSILMLKKGGDTTVFDAAWRTDYRHSYVARNLTWNGTDAGEYAIVYPADGTRYEKQLASRLADRLFLLTGIAAWQLLPDSDEVGQTTLTIGAVAKHGEQTVALTGDTAYALSCAVDALLEQITGAAENGTAALTFEGDVTGTAAESFRVMSYNVYGFNVSSPRTDRVCQLVRRYLPDIVLFQETAKNWVKVLNREFSDYYGVALGLPRHNGQEVNNPGADTYLPIYYAKDRYELLESGTRWLTDTPDAVSILPGAQYYRTFTWAKLRDRVTGEEFLVVNNHLDTASDAIRKKEMRMTLSYLAKQYPTTPILFGGDMNNGIGSPAVDLAQACGFENAGAITKTIDLLLYTPDSVSASDWTNLDDLIDGVAPSDHPAVMARFTVKAPAEPAARDWSALDEADIPTKPDEEPGFGPVIPLY